MLFYFSRPCKPNILLTDPVCRIRPQGTWALLTARMVTRGQHGLMGTGSEYLHELFYVLQVRVKHALSWRFQIV